ncbi:hypothetical protein F9B85_08190 [Heliorestis acidaminivorans]|uniref:Uncharacterized protein n=1 Tax=Heliorestis acidaminivorans TaxID=553427 RepID=A0A6I0F5R2_9FIRM|nr:hypothetical protein [Heliorestis acidaminivorans]KAB2952629.1 hypothetical protein F9B85_08190 [Heliorestis acidaminivorans]
MTNIRTGEDWRLPLKARVRLDFRTPYRKSKLFFSSNNLDKEAAEIREQQVGLLRNVPIQGIEIENIDLTAEVYCLVDEITGREVAFAPVILTIRADTLEDLLRFTMRDDFRKIELVEPEEIYLQRFELERFIYRLNEEQKRIIQTMERKLSGR